MLVPILGCILPSIGRYKTNMSLDKTKIGEDNKVISLAEAAKTREGAEPVFSKGLYEWIMFIISFYSRVRQTLKIDFETFIILQVVVSHSLYHLNKDGFKKFTEIQKNFDLMSMSNLSKINKLAFASIAEVLQLPRETVRRKVLQLEQKEIVKVDDVSGIILGPAYKTIYKEFVSKTTIDTSTLVKRWNTNGTLERLLQMDKK